MWRGLLGTLVVLWGLAPATYLTWCQHRVSGALAFLYLDAVSGPALTAMLNQTQQEDTYVDGTADVIEGPILGNMARMQQKFESANSETLLNGNSTTRTVIP